MLEKIKYQDHIPKLDILSLKKKCPNLQRRVLDRLLSSGFISFYKSVLPQWLTGKESSCSAGDTGVSGLIPGSGRCLEHPL